MASASSAQEGFRQRRPKPGGPKGGLKFEHETKLQDTWVDCIDRLLLLLYGRYIIVDDHRLSIVPLSISMIYDHLLYPPYNTC